MEHSNTCVETVIMAIVKIAVSLLAHGSPFVKICTDSENVMLLHPVTTHDFICQQKEDFSGGSDFTGGAP